MRLNYLSKREIQAMDDLKASYGGAKKIAQAIEQKRTYDYRKKVATQKGFGQIIQEAEELVRRFPKVDEFKNKTISRLPNPVLLPPRSLLGRVIKSLIIA